MQAWLVQEGVLCMRSYKPFLHEAKTERSLYRGGRDKLHLNNQGDQHLTEFIQYFIKFFVPRYSMQKKIGPNRI